MLIHIVYVVLLIQSFIISLHIRAKQAGKSSVSSNFIKKSILILAFADEKFIITAFFCNLNLIDEHPTDKLLEHLQEPL